MYDCFISYAHVDAALATDVATFLQAQKLRVFLAPLAIPPGSAWSPAIRKALTDSTWVLFLASQAACQSPAVQQEVGAAVFGGKKLVPVVWDIDPTALPAWAQEYQALDLRERDTTSVLAAMEELAKQVRSSKAMSLLIVVGLLSAIALILLAARASRQDREECIPPQRAA